MHPGLVLKCSSRISQLVDAKPEMKTEAKITGSQAPRGNLEKHSLLVYFLKDRKNQGSRKEGLLKDCSLK